MQNIKIPKNVSKPWLKKIQLMNPVAVSIMYCFLFSFRNQIKLSFMSFEGFEMTPVRFTRTMNSGIAIGLSNLEPFLWLSINPKTWNIASQILKASRFLEDLRKRFSEISSWLIFWKWFSWDRRVFVGILIFTMMIRIDVTLGKDPQRHFSDFEVFEGNIGPVKNPRVKICWRFYP